MQQGTHTQPPVRAVGRPDTRPRLNDEGEWIARAMQGDSTAFDVLFTHYRTTLTQYLLRFVRDRDMVEDIVQDTFLKVYRAIHQFRQRESFKGWLYAIARNTWKNHLRSAHFERFDTAYDVYAQGIACDGCIEQDVIDAQQLHRLQAAITRLPGRQRQTVQLRINEQLRFGEIASLMQCSVNTAKSNHYFAVRKLQEDLLA